MNQEKIDWRLFTKNNLSRFLLKVANNASKLTSDSRGSAEQQAVTSYRYTTGLVFDELMLKHECTCRTTANHLETPERIRAIWSRLHSSSLVDDCELVRPRLASVAELFACHSEKYALTFGSELEARTRLPKEYLQEYMESVCLGACNGFALTLDPDNSWNEEFTPLACRVAVGSTYELARLVYEGTLRNGFALVRPPGSHAEFNKPL